MSSRNSIVTRSLAAFLALYTLVASGRSLIPGLCATQAAIEEREQANSDCGARSCCAPATEPGEYALVDGSYAETPQCAFCKLAKATIEPIHLATPAIRAQVASFVKPAEPDSPRLEPAALCEFGRAPPLA